VTTLPLVALSPVVGLQVYVLAPVTVNVVESPAHKVALLTLKVGLVVVATLALAVIEQEFASDTVTVYDPPANELAIALFPPEGVQVYVYPDVPPLAVTIRLPLFAPHEAGEFVVMLAVSAEAGCAIVMVVVTEQDGPPLVVTV
jgi:hypothetical protein